MVNLLALVICCLVLSWVSVLVRYGVKIFMIGRVRWDDWILMLGVVGPLFVPDWLGLTVHTDFVQRPV